MSPRVAGLSEQPAFCLLTSWDSLSARVLCMRNRSCYLLFSTHRHACVIRGQVMTSDGTPLVGVNISFVNNPLFGYTISRQDGR